MNLLFISVHYNFQNFLCTQYVPAALWTYHHGGLFPLLVRRSPYMLVEHLHTTIPIMADIAIASTTSGTIAA